MLSGPSAIAVPLPTLVSLFSIGGPPCSDVPGSSSVPIVAATLLATGSILTPAAQGQSTATPQANSQAGPLDAFWLQSAIQGDRFEIEGGQLAQQLGTTQEVRDLGARLVADHTQSLNDAISLAEQLQVEVPDQPTPTEQWQLQIMQTMSGAELDQQYLALEVADHKQDIEEAQTEVDQGETSNVKDEASKDLPVLQDHLVTAQQLQAVSAATMTDGNGVATPAA